MSHSLEILVDGLDVLYEDNHLLVVVKPSGMLSQGDRTGDPSLLDVAKLYLKKKYQKPGNVYLGLVHRLDRPAGGVLVFARTSKAARRLSEAFRNRDVEKHYLAVVSGRPDPEADERVDFLKKSGMKTLVTTPDDPEGKEAKLRYSVLETVDDMSLLSVALLTGRRHQIRVQLAEVGCPVIGDVKYGGGKLPSGGVIALFAYRLVIPHPISDSRVEFSARPPDDFPWSLFPKI